MRPNKYPDPWFWLLLIGFNIATLSWGLLNLTTAVDRVAYAIEAQCEDPAADSDGAPQ